MTHRLAYGFCTAICIAGLAGAAQAAPVTYTWDTLSTVPPDNGGSPAPPLQLSFTVDGAVTVNADDSFANVNRLPPAVQVAYPFPADLMSFDLHVADLSVTLADFVSPSPPSRFAPGFPIWSIGLTADPTALSASLSLFFINDTDTEEIYGPPPGSENAAQIGTAALGTIGFGADFYETDFPAEYTGKLVAGAAAAPEPASIWLLIGSLGMLGLIRPASIAARRRRPPLTA
ncbi:MAG: hypothetical protein ACREE9_14715 [Stellaceae bacterium]